MEKAVNKIPSLFYKPRNDPPAAARRGLLLATLLLALAMLACGPLARPAPTPTPFPTPPPPPLSVIIVIPTYTPWQSAPTPTLPPASGPAPTHAPATSPVAPTPPPVWTPTPAPEPTRRPTLPLLNTATLPPSPTVTSQPASTPTASPAGAGQPTDTPTATSPAGTTQPTGTLAATSAAGAATPTATGQPAGSPTATSAPSGPTSPTPATLSNQPLVQPVSVQVYETTLSIPTYDYQSALVPTDSSDSIYPYPRLDFSRLGGKSPKSYRALILENAYVRVTVLPELGGRIYAWVDKTNDKAIAYSNPVIKPVQDWGARGWWLATGGMEWCLPTDEHGLNEYRPWDATLDSASITVEDEEDRTGLNVQVVLSLDSAHNYLTIQPRLTNNTGSRQTFKFWLNAMLAFSNNRAGDATHFIMPTVTQATIHSTNDNNLPGAGAAVDWPVHNGRDISVIGNLGGWLGLFARPNAQADFAGAYDTTADMGIVRIFPSGTATGLKFFTPRGLDSSKWTDDSSSYFELWGGLRPTFSDEATIESGQTRTWEERWYPVNGLKGSYDYANAAAALRIENDDNSVLVGVAASSNLDQARIRLWQDGQVVAEWRASLGPGRPVSATWPRPAGSCSGADCNRLGLQLLDAAGAVLAQTGTLSP